MNDDSLGKKSCVVVFFKQTTCSMFAIYNCRWCYYSTRLAGASCAERVMNVAVSWHEASTSFHLVQSRQARCSADPAASKWRGSLRQRLIGRQSVWSNICLVLPSSCYMTEDDDKRCNSISFCLKYPVEKERKVAKRKRKIYSFPDGLGRKSGSLFSKEPPSRLDTYW